MDWHHAFRLICSDQFTNTPFDVEGEYRLDQIVQLLDVLLIRRRPGLLEEELPDGFDNLADHNLITFKSHQETFELWTILELMSYYVLYRKQIGPKNYLPTNHFRLFGVSSRFPQQMSNEIELIPVRQGVYDIVNPFVPVRLIVVNELRQTPINAGLKLLSSTDMEIRYGIVNYRQKNPEIKSLFKEIVEHYGGPSPMPDPMIEFKKKVRAQWMSEVTPEELATVPIEKRIASMTPEERLSGMSPQEILARIPPEDLFAKMSPEEIERYLERIRQPKSEPSGSE